MSILNTEFYNGKDIYDDGDIESKLLDYYKNPNSAVDIHNDVFFYFITDTRQNILNWYPFKKECSILEIGPGCGTLTGMLCKKAKEVVAIEGSKRRAEITHYRHKNQKNLKVYAGDFTDIKITQKFDYIVMVGVFEYANQFFPDLSNPFDYYLEKLRPFLKNDGKILIAIENRYGLKYWAGCNEDHIVKPYVGLEGYENSKICRTFGKKELTALLNRHGFSKIKFYYPFPDYKLPNIIYSDAHPPKPEEVLDIPFYPYNNKINFNMHEVMRGILDNNAFDFFSNSFLVEFGNKACSLSSATYAKVLNYRNQPYKTITTLFSDHTVKKTAIYPSGVNHLKNIAKIHEKLSKSGINTCSTKLVNNELCIDFVKGSSCCNELLKLAKSHDYKKIEELFDKLLQFYRSVSTLKSFSNPIHAQLLKLYPEKTYILNYSLIDGNISNIIIDEKGDFCFVDQEWTSNKQLPADYLLYFSILYFGRYTKIVDQEFIQKLFTKYKITKAKQHLFCKIEKEYYKNQKVINVKEKNKLDSCKSFIYTEVAPEAPIPESTPEPEPEPEPVIQTPLPKPSIARRVASKTKRCIRRIIR